MKLFISENVPSLKNGKSSFGGRIVHSKTVKKYLTTKGIQDYKTKPIKIKDGDTRIFTCNNKVVEYKTRPNLFKREIQPLRLELSKYKTPYHVGFYFIRKTRAKFDFQNAIQILLDLMTAHEIIEDDNCDIVLPYPVLDSKGMCYKVDKENPGVWIVVMNSNQLK